MTSLRWLMARTAVAGLTVLVVAAACSGPRSGASATSNISGCAAVLPLARSIVHEQGTLTLIQRINQADADALARQFGITPAASPPAHSPPRGFPRPAGTRFPKTCLIVYQGNYPPGAITGASPPALSGRYALIMLRVRHPSIDRILVTDRLPANLHHHPTPSASLKRRGRALLRLRGHLPAPHQKRTTAMKIKARRLPTAAIMSGL